MGCACRGGRRVVTQSTAAIVGYEFIAPDGTTTTFLTPAEAKAARRLAGGGTVIAVKNTG